MQSPVSALSVLAVVYTLCLAGLNLVLFLISDFYRRKFNQPSPRLGFLLALAMNGVCAVVLLLQEAVPPFVKPGSSFLLLCSGALAIYSTISLHLTMKRIRK